MSAKLALLHAECSASTTPAKRGCSVSGRVRRGAWADRAGIVDFVLGSFDLLWEGDRTMKYVLLFCGSLADQEAFDALSPDELRARYAEVGRWFQQHRSQIVESQQLQGPATATTVRFGRDGQPTITDGPFVETNEIVGGYAAVEVADFDEALRMAQSWPGRGVIEIRPVMVR